jgi:hypothetical protein
MANEEHLRVLKPVLFCIALLGLLSGCLRREGLKAHCQWPHEPERNLDLHSTADQRHLRDDAQFAEELAIRYSDPLRQTEGMTVARNKRIECMTVLFDQIAALHGATADEVSQSAFHRDANADFAFVFFPMAAFFILFAYRLCGRMFQRIDSRSSATVITFIISILVSACGVLVGEMWALGVETFRVGNGHLSFRTARIPWLHERAYLFAIGMMLFWFVAVVQYYRTYLVIKQGSNTRRSLLGLE